LLNDTNTSQIIYIHQNVPGVLRKGKSPGTHLAVQWHPLTMLLVNEILGEHNVDKQITDSRGDVSTTLRRVHVGWPVC
jgi:D-3-phosphoglycerate dehydrogenase / 2-oxoglutarate reductase